MTFKHGKHILQLAIPSMVENILQMLMGMVDSYLVAQVGLLAVSGVSLATNIITIYQALFIALGSAISSLIARSLAENNPDKHQKYISDALLITLLLSLGFGVLSLFFGQKVLEVLGADRVLAQTGSLYLAIVGGMIVSLGLLTSLGAIVRAQGDAKLPMQVSLVTNIINAILSTLAIYSFGLGLIGVAWATVISRFVGIMILLQKVPLKGLVKHFSFRLDQEMLNLSLAAAGERLMMRLGDVLIVMIIVRLGTKVLAGNAIGETISQFNYMPGMAIATATIILVARQYGQENYSDIQELIKEVFLLSTIIMLALSLITFLLGPLVSSLFTNDPQALKASMIVLLFSLVCAPATAGTLVYTALWQGLGNARLPFYATTVGMWLVRIVLGYVLAIWCNLGLTGVWLATGLDNGSRWLILASCFKRYNRRIAIKKE
ncbi:MATE family efflux transporter [Streptococcus iniae]|uniref:MATE family efflux transporter n=1 Tax=Streptococcus iniae TaxID=1346 RepID=UPI0008DAA1E9|nr:MATE family efflux transporter [Streptococcus iniae]OHX27238.1 MATE family efflux transporter [Streptococcus iniae]RLV28720.1 MATE family efflux transporter [Streptococcus iniae]